MRAKRKTRKQRAALIRARIEAADKTFRPAKRA
jgi:hypothetical protein